MDACEAFCIAVKFCRSGEWSPALPARNTINVDGKDLTLRQVCSLVEHVTRPLPEASSVIFSRVYVSGTLAWKKGC
jgi:hypothetical protein